MGGGLGLRVDLCMLCERKRGGVPRMEQKRDPIGRYLPGGPGNPGPRDPAARRQRLARADSLYTAIPPGRVGPMLRDAYEVARQQNSPRCMLACISLYLRYAIGKPRQMDAGGNEGVERLLAALTTCAPAAPDRGPWP